MKERFVCVMKHGSGTTSYYGSSAYCHAELGKFAGDRGLKLHIHEGILWTSTDFSAAYQGSDPLLGAQGYVKRMADY